MPLNPVIAQVLASLPTPSPGPIDPVALRAADEAHLAPVAERPVVARVDDEIAHTVHGDVPVRIYRDGDGDRGILVYLHGGAFFLGSLDTHDHIARALAAATGLTVVSAGYRLAPEHPFPAGLDDATGVVRWAADRFPGPVRAVAGDSSGGTFAAAVAARLHDEGFDRITHQVLLYPSLDLDFDQSRYPSLVENATGYGLEYAGLAPFNAFYLRSGADPDDPLVSPIKRVDLAGLPPALIVTAEYDPLRDEGERYGQRLRGAGVDATVVRMPGVNHGFVQNFPAIDESRRTIDRVAAFLGAP
ncbi:alpha/beta hydrolase [Microbacterium elymi]|uniref:Alpha/beta hydrolase n=1 Tax=Microbacterium elymi TaxID=2909587 RepID=A0ABY5NGW0_9MICO|nr:alpha/beta hydrolase [Microbacterium elymi]UUT34381.1 alpha/beta hydrolase [Microbacterium elymi]